MANAEHGQTLRGLVPEDLLKFRWLREIVVAPDGSRVAYTVSRPDAQRNSYQTDVYLMDLATGWRRKVSAGAGQGSALAFSRDGNHLAYVWRGQDGSIAVEIISPEGEREKAFPIEGGVPQELDWSPDGKRLAFVRWTEVRREGDFRRFEGIPAPTIRVVRRLRYKQDGVGWVHDRYRHLWTLDVESGDLTQLTDGECDYGEPRWSGDGKRIACMAMAREQNAELGQGRVWVLDLDQGTATDPFPEWRGAGVSPQWRADDKAIAFAGYEGGPPVNRRRFYHVFLGDLETGTVRELTQGLDQTVGNYAVADQRPGLTNITVKWPGGRGRIYFLLTEEGATHLYSVGEGGDWRQEVGGKAVVFEYAPSQEGLVAFGKADPTHPGELYVLRDGETHRLTDLNPWLRFRKLSLPREYWYEGVGGARVHAWEMLPIGFTEGRRYPTIVYVHCSMFSWDFNHEFQCLANAGYVVTYFNQRGTTAGYGQAWTFASEGDQGGKDYEEIMLGVDDLVRRPYVDGTRLGVTGGSCGGFMTNWIVGHTDRFAAAVTQRSIANQISFFGTSDIGPEGTERETGANPWTDLGAVWRQSPLAYADRIRTPLLILHSEEDHRCPVSQAEELFAALRWMGRKVELVIFEGESHGLSRGGRPGNRIERLRRILGWFREHLGTDPR
ncbi:MAG: S9 family peptidase [Anaerolineae bacterium]